MAVVASRADLLERAGVLEAVDGLLADARAGRGGALFVVGEAGLGKTVVLEQALARAAADMDVGHGRGETMERVVAFGLATQVLSALGAGELVTPALSGAPPVAEPTVPYHRMLRWLERRSGPPLLLAVDDLHWADAESLSLFAFLARRLEPLPVALIGTLRPWPSEAFAVSRSLADGWGARSESVAPLSREGVQRLLASRSDTDISEATAARAFTLAGGNPLLTEQLAIALARGEPIPEAGAGIPQLGERLLLSRFAGLDGDALACAQAASVLGTNFRPELAAEIAGVGDGAVDGALDALLRSGLVRDRDAASVGFAHPLLAQALYDDLPPPLRRRLHDRAFRALAALGLDAEASEHAVRAELEGDATAIAVLSRAGLTALAAGATVTAARNLEAAVRFSGDRAPPDLLLALCEALTACGRVEEAAAVCKRLIADPELSWEDRVDALRLHGRALYLVGAPDHGEGVLLEAAELAAAHGSDRAVQSLLDLSLSVWLEHGPGRALPVADRARGLAQAVRPELRERAEAAWGHLALESGDPEGVAATDLVEDVLQGPDAARLLDPAELTWPWATAYQFAMNCNYTDRHGFAERTFRRCWDVVEEAGAANSLAVLAIYIANSAIRSGRLEAAFAAANDAQEFSELTPGALPYAYLEQAEVAAWQGRLDDSESLCTQAEELAAGQWFAQLWLAHVRGMRLLWQGDERASEELSRAEEITRSVGIREPCHIHWQSHAIAAHLACGRVDAATAVIEWIEDCARSLPCRWPRIAAAFGRAELAAHAGEADTAEEHYREALDLHAETDLPLHRTETLLGYGGFLRRNGRPVESRPQLAEALRLAETTGAGWLRAAAREELRLAGGRRRRAAQDRDELTPAEERVTDLAAERHTNADIARLLHLSVNTVETHLKHAYLKLGIHSRRQLPSKRDPT